MQILIPILMIYQTSTGLDLDKLCADVKTKTISVEAAQTILDTDTKQVYEIQIEEICE